MNKQRRTAIAAALEELSGCESRIQEILDEEQDAFDNLPEAFQDSARGDAAQEALNNLETAHDLVEEAISALEDARE